MLLNGLQAIKEAAKQQHGATVSYVEPKGGYFVWVELPAALDARDILDRRHGLAPSPTGIDVRFLPGAKCSSNPDAPKNTLRLCYAAYVEEDLEAGMQQLQAILLAAIAEMQV